MFRLTDHPNMTKGVYYGHKTIRQQHNIINTCMVKKYIDLLCSLKKLYHHYIETIFASEPKLPDNHDSLLSAKSTFILYLTVNSMHI